MARRQIDSLLIKNDDDSYAGVVTVGDIKKANKSTGTIGEVPVSENAVSYVSESAMESFDKLLNTDSSYVVVLHEGGGSMKAAAVHKKPPGKLMTDVTYQKENEAFLEVMAYKDELTGLDNRRSGLRTIDTFIQKGIPFSLCMIDMDGLKNINDRFGHLYGDEYIKFVSKALKESAGDTDFTCRFGGDEFVALFRDCGEQAAEEKMGLIDKKLAAGGRVYPMSISYGVVYVAKEMGLSPEAALNIADERMYRLKRRRKRKNAGSEAEGI